MKGLSSVNLISALVSGVEVFISGRIKSKTVPDGTSFFRKLEIDIGPVRSGKELKRKLKRVNAKMYAQLNEKVKGLSDEDRNTLLDKIYVNYMKLKNHVGQKDGKQIVGNKFERLLELAEKEEQLDEVLPLLFSQFVKMVSAGVNNTGESSRIMRNLRNKKLRNVNKTKLFSLFEKNMPEPTVSEPVTKEIVDKFKSNEVPFYKHFLIEIIIPDPSNLSNKKINELNAEGLHKGESKYKGKTYESWNTLVKEGELNSYMSGRNTKIQILYNALNDESSKIRKTTPTLTGILLGETGKKTSTLTTPSLDIAEGKVQRIDALDQNQMEAYFKTLRFSGESDNKGPSKLHMKRLNGQKITNYIFFKLSNQYPTIKVIEKLLSADPSDNLFMNIVKDLPLANSLSKEQYKTYNPKKREKGYFNTEGGEKELEREYKKYLRKTEISQGLIDEIKEEYDDLYGDGAIEEKIKPLGKANNIYFPKNVEQIKIINDLLQEIEEEIDAERLNDLYSIPRQGRTLDLVIKSIIISGDSLESKLINDSNLEKYFKGSEYVSATAFLAIVYRLLSRIMQESSKLDNQVKKIDSLVEKEGEGLSLDDDPLQSAIGALANSIKKGLKRLNAEFRKELILDLNNKLQNPTKYQTLFKGKTGNRLREANILVEEQQNV